MSTENQYSILEQRGNNFNEGIATMSAGAVSKLLDLTFYIKNTADKLEGLYDLCKADIDALNNLRWEAQEIEEIIIADLQIRVIEYEEELKKIVE